MAQEISSKKSLAVYLSRLKRSDSFNAKLEQYITDSEVASTLLWHAFLNNDITNKTVLDAGCGNGILGIGAIILAAKHVTFVDIDAKMIEVCQSNLNIIDQEFETADKRHALIAAPIQTVEKQVDTVIMNPPFGIQTKHADQPFLNQAFQISKTIYSIHDANTIEFLQKAARKNKWTMEELDITNMHLKRTMKFHKKERHFIRVVMAKFSKPLS